jgi:hypothetical protein
MSQATYARSGTGVSASRGLATDGGVDLVAFTYLGKPATLFTVRRGELQAFALLHGSGPRPLALRFVGSQTRSN